MSFDELVSELQRRYENAPRGEVATSIILFGIKYADDLSRVSVADLVEKAGILRKRIVTT